ncbi:CehA/McbA family metallohydrolase [Aerococcaceae bacterium DSM 111021]|nr:CehA/McbA family metallohydrolase [Aerococcaceae bacterium DSM 111021]
MKRYQYPVEVHAHTIHSDGQFTVEELIESAVSFGYKGLILTDHNTSAGYLEMPSVQAVKDEDIITLHGIEWTTYFGHMLVHDADYDVDWREATPTTIDKYMLEVQLANGLVGIAHPFDIGSPICTGCHWDYQVENYDLVDYIEIWNSNQPQEKSESILAYEFWLDKLNKGYEISCSAGRDWHRPDREEANMGVTYLELNEEELTQENFKEALRKGRYYITLGPTAHFNIENKNIIFQMGDRVHHSMLEQGSVSVNLKSTELEALKGFELNNIYLSLWNNDQLIYKSEVNKELSEELALRFTLPDNLSAGYLRFEVRGDFRGVKDTPIIVGNPIYLRK